MFVFEVILVRIFPGFSRIRTEYGEKFRISPYSVRMRENAGKIRTRITQNMDSFYTVNELFSDNDTVQKLNRNDLRESLAAYESFFHS